MVKLRWLQVNKFRSVKPGTRLDFHPGSNVLLGQNGTGKTTLLNLVAAVVKSDFTDFEDIEFDVEYELNSELGTIATISVRNEFRASPLQEALEGLRLPPNTRAPDSKLQSLTLLAGIQLSWKSAGLRLSLSIQGARITALRTDQPAQQSIKIDSLSNKPVPMWAQAIIGATHWGSETSTNLPSNLFDIFFEELYAARFDESLEYFDRLSKFKIEAHRLGQAKPQLLDTPVTKEYGTALLEQLEHQWGADRYVLSEKAIPSLRDTVRLLNFESAEAIIELQESTREKSIESVKLGNLRFLFKHRSGLKIAEHHLSYGQKRILAFLHYVATARSIVIADELVNGLHHSWIHACIEALGERQVFLTSQNPLLLDYLTFESPEEVRSRFVLCRWEEGGEQMVWENMSQEAAEDFFSSYKVGFQQVGELLQSKGLW